jgi:hypothetical protein
MNCIDEHLYRVGQSIKARFPPEGGWGISPPQNYSRRDIPLNLIFGGNFFSGFENLTCNLLSVILRHLEAELIILWCLKLTRGPFPP